MKYSLLLLVVVLFYGCYYRNPGYDNSNPPLYTGQKVWGSKPVYAAESAAKQIGYKAEKQPLLQAGNIYAFRNYIFQVDVGRGIHVIDNSVPAQADRIGFITVNGCTQISIKGAYLYTNSIADLVTLDISNPAQVREVSRVPNAFPEFQYTYPLIRPNEKGYYACPLYDSVVIGWVKDSIDASCYNP